MADQGFQRPPRKKNALDNRKLNMSAPCPTAQGKYSNLIWGLYANNPRLTVYTGDPEEQGNERLGYGKISANLDTPTLFAFIELLKWTITAEGEVKNKIENKNYTWFDRKRSETPVMVSELWVGKKADGRVWISITAPNRPMIQFFFKSPEFHDWCDSTGAKADPGLISRMYAGGYTGLLSEYFGHLQITEWEEPPPPKDKQGGGGFQRGGQQGGGNRGAGGGGSYGGNKQAPVPAADAGGSGEDYPF